MKWTRRRVAGLVLVAVAATVTAVLGFTVGDGEKVAPAGGVALGGGAGAASCLPFSEDALGLATVALDGTVTAIDGSRATVTVEKWYRGGEGGTAALEAPDLVGDAATLEGGVPLEVGGRYLVSGDRVGDAIQPAVCGFSVTWSEEWAATFARAF
jgi:hypothetical protein